jgi:hypothetical protein
MAPKPRKRAPAATAEQTTKTGLIYAAGAIIVALVAVLGGTWLVLVRASDMSV